MLPKQGYQYHKLRKAFSKLPQTVLRVDRKIQSWLENYLQQRKYFMAIIPKIQKHRLKAFIFRPVQKEYHARVINEWDMAWILCNIINVRKRAKIRNRYNQAPHLTQNTNGKVTTSQFDTTNESQEVSPFPAGDRKASINRCARNHNKNKTEIT